MVSGQASIKVGEGRRRWKRENSFSGAGIRRCHQNREMQYIIYIYPNGRCSVTTTAGEAGVEVQRPIYSIFFFLSLTTLPAPYSMCLRRMACPLQRRIQLDFQHDLALKRPGSFTWLHGAFFVPLSADLFRELRAPLACHWTLAPRHKKAKM